jgi:anti-sigma regulatory factor (Ser/Thr protein kinase)
MNGPNMGESDRHVEAARTPPSLERTLRNDLESLVAATQALEELLDRHAVSPDTGHACILALEEIVTNILKYAYSDRAVHEIRFAASVTASHVVLQFSDDGREFDPLTAPEPDLDLPLEERPIGGLGIHLIRKLADRMEYQRAGDRNVLTVSFALQPKE